MITTLEEFLPERKKLKDENKKLVFTNGCFDILHRGHVEYLNQAKDLGDLLIIGLNSDDSVKRLKGQDRPINNENDRAFLLDNLKSVDYVIVFNEDTPYNLIKEIIPDFLVKGGDWKEEDIVGYDIVKENGGEVKSLNYVNNYSTTGLIEKINR
ncbi:MAG: D-glycero-beta-D-manno-heptose 1-phosphate adenylyltransferase [Ignavibacteriae bacterium]|nr:D-glycero-beta-D-manno-heptose 1-phosphate adenylyltransferase [Ignavibacteriota bacterium]MCB9242672.1 D-glycero-beta-D-manno-heptose 1-phosphate adenylyltransferase [Ignavibacteriales bacterium]